MIDNCIEKRLLYVSFTVEWNWSRERNAHQRSATGMQAPSSTRSGQRQSGIQWCIACQDLAAMPAADCWAPTVARTVRRNDLHRATKQCSHPPKARGSPQKVTELRIPRTQLSAHLRHSVSGTGCVWARISMRGTNIELLSSIVCGFQQPALIECVWATAASTD